MAEAGSEPGTERVQQQQRRLRKQFNLAEQNMETKAGEQNVQAENEEEHPFFRDPSILAKVNRHLRVAWGERGDRGGGARADNDQPTEHDGLHPQ